MRRVILLLTVMAATLVVASGVALAVTKIGTDGPDVLVGTDEDDNLFGLGGNDLLFALAGDDTLLGGPGKDLVLGGSACCPERGDKNLIGGSGNDFIASGLGSDNVVGNAGNDLVNGDAGSDIMTGTSGSDLLIDGPILVSDTGDIEAVLPEGSKDALASGNGNDWIDAKNDPASRDTVACGTGFDRVLADGKDVVAPDCERVRFGPTHGRFLETIPQWFFEGLPR